MESLSTPVQAPRASGESLFDYSARLTAERRTNFTGECDHPGGMIATHCPTCGLFLFSRDD